MVVVVVVEVPMLFGVLCELWVVLKLKQWRFFDSFPLIDVIVVEVDGVAGDCSLADGIPGKMIQPY